MREARGRGAVGSGLGAKTSKGRKSSESFRKHGTYRI